MNPNLSIAGFRLPCADIAGAKTFYERVLGAMPDFSGNAPSLVLGRGAITLVPGARRREPAPSNSTAFQHLAIIVSDMEAAMGRLQGAAGWSPISRAGPERLPARSGGVTAFKFRDTEGHPLEFLAFPPGAVPPVWRGREGVILGIDHSAITVADVARAIAFYEERGFTVSARQINRGIEQERMDGVDGAVVDVVGLAPPGEACPHLELLHYREPGTLSARAADDDVLATRVMLSDSGGSTVADFVDPDGHRFSGGT